jgi:P27 family predicted phage terminase small subunit
MAGRRPKPSALKALAGNPGKRAINTSEPKPTGIPTCPRHLDKEARLEWKRISTELIVLGLLTSVDRAALAGYCVAWSRWVAAELSIQKFGLVIKSPKSGFPIQNPYVSVANTALDQIRKFGIEFGLTPSSRSRLHIDAAGQPAKSDDPFTEFMRGLVTDNEPTSDEVETETV